VPPRIGWAICSAPRRAAWRFVLAGFPGLGIALATMFLAAVLIRAPRLPAARVAPQATGDGGGELGDLRSARGQCGLRAGIVRSSGSARASEQRNPDAEPVGDHLVQAHRSAEVLQPLVAEVPHAHAGHASRRAPRRVADDHLSAVSHGADPCGPVDVDAHVVVAREERSTCVEAYSDTHGTPTGPDRRIQLPLRSDGRSQRVVRAGEHDEEPVSRDVHLGAVVVADRPAHDPPMFLEEIHEVTSELLEQARRSFRCR
jgi:hypothetical protein